MKQVLSSLGLALVALPLLGQQLDRDTLKPSKESRNYTAEFVSASSTQKTITIKVDDASALPARSKTVTAKVDASLMSSLESIRPGEKVMLTCYADLKGDCETVTGVVKKGKTS
jgi:hypothetical protein